MAAGRKTALVERELIGGTCINYGCTPTKTMIASAGVAYGSSHSERWGVDTSSTRTDMPAVRQRKRDIVKSFREGSTRSIRAGGVDIIMGDARFTDSHTVEVSLQEGGARTLSADSFFIDVGSRPTDPPIHGLDAVPHLNSTTIMELGDVPEHLVILGGGYIGLEFAQMFRRFGSRVTVVEQTGQLLGREDQDVAGCVENILREDGIDIFLKTTASSVASGESGGIRLTVKDGDEERVVEGSHLLVAVGRTVNTDGLGLDAAGVGANKRGVIIVDDHLRTSVRHIWALGECAGTAAFTHMAYDDFRVVRDSLLRGQDHSTRGRLTPYTAFIDPQLGRVGMSEREAKEADRSYRLAKMPMSQVARALESDDSRGFMKALVDPDTRQILGVAVLGMEGGEIMAMFELAMMGQLPYTVLGEGIFAHPTLAESVNSLFSNFQDHDSTD